MYLNVLLNCVMYYDLK